jgi:hypothetical protein
MSGFHAKWADDNTEKGLQPHGTDTRDSLYEPCKSKYRTWSPEYTVLFHFHEKCDSTATI